MEISTKWIKFGETNEEIQFLKQSSDINFNPGNTWPNANSSNSRPATVWPTKEVK